MSKVAATTVQVGQTPDPIALLTAVAAGLQIDGRLVFDAGSVTITTVGTDHSMRLPNGIQIAYGEVDLGSSIVQGAGTYASPYGTAAANVTFAQAFAALISVTGALRPNSNVYARRAMTVTHRLQSVTGLTDVTAYKVSSDATSATVFWSYLAIGTWA